MAMDDLKIELGTELAILGEHSATAIEGKGEKCTRCGRSLKHAFVLGGAIYGPVCVRKMGGVVVAVSRSKANKVEVDIETPGDRDQLNCFEQHERFQEELQARLGEN